MKLDLPTTPEFASLAAWEQMTGMPRRTAYELLGLGRLKAVKLGSKTLIDVTHGLAYLRSLPPAKIKPPRPATGLRKARTVVPEVASQASIIQPRKTARKGASGAP